MISSIFLDPSRRRPRAAWRISIGFIAMMVVIGTLAAAVDTIEIPFVESFLWQLFAAPILVGLAWLFARRIDRRSFRDYGLAWQPWRVVVGALLAVGFVSLIFVVQLRIGWATVGDRMHNRYEVPFIAGWIGFALRYASVAVFEELFHRGFLITNLAEGLGGARPRYALACVLAALLFGALHLTNENATPLGAINITLLGLTFGLVFLWTRSLSVSIGLHFGWNFGLGPVCGLPVSGYEPRVSLVLSETHGSALWTGGQFGPEGGLLTTIVLVAALAIFGTIRRLIPTIPRS
jgi:membrane protease YdiL (CAAX protease family)